MSVNTKCVSGVYAPMLKLLRMVAADDKDRLN